MVDKVLRWVLPHVHTIRHINNLGLLRTTSLAFRSTTCTAVIVFGTSLGVRTDGISIV